MLTKKQEGFALDVAAGMDQTAAYKANYDTKTERDATVYANASVTANKGKVRARIKEHVDKAFDGQDIKEYVLGKLKKQLETGANEGAKMQAAKLLGQTEGMFREVVEASESLMSIDDLVSSMAKGDEKIEAMLRAHFELPPAETKG